MDTLVAQLAGLNGQITTAEAAVLDLQTRVKPLLAQRNQLNDEVSARGGPAGHPARPAVVARRSAHHRPRVLRDLQAQKKTNKDAIAAQTTTVKGLQDKLGGVQAQINAIDATIALGGCAT
jgi:hypothetical protein